MGLAGYWWHGFFPDTMRQMMGERLDMLPWNKQVAYFSDAYCAEWAYAKSVLVRKMLAAALAERVERGQYNTAAAVALARNVLYESAHFKLGMRPCNG